jgi:Mlc titration factor MtfA (ptsG expression regulator)
VHFRSRAREGIRRVAFPSGSRSASTNLCLALGARAAQRPLLWPVVPVSDAAGILAVAAVLAVAFLIGRALFVLLARRTAARRFRRGPIPSAWGDILDRNVPLARSLTPDERERLLRLVQVFLHDKPFEGCAGLEVTEEMKVTIAGHACLLLLNLDGPCYPSVQCVLVYPEAFLAKRLQPNWGITLEPLPGPHPLAGESWHGVVLVSWDDVRRSVADPHDGQNVALHEFAHELDKEDGWADGVPLLGSRSAVRTWGRVLAEHYERLRGQADRGEPSALDSYGATNKAEFFAVATETFFENPHALQATAPDLYEMLKAYYRQDPATRA